MPSFKSSMSLLVSICLFSSSFSTWSADWEITPFLGKAFSSDITNSDSASLSLNDSANYGLALAWQDSPNGQGQILINYTNHDFNSTLDNQNYALNIIYAHFNGIAQFRQHGYVTTVSLGLGGAYFDTDFGEELYPSLTAAVGTRYEFSDNLAFVTELRGYASVVKKDNDLFCRNNVCVAQIDDPFWIETILSVGISYRF
ncbi:MAG: hypothetical protein ACI9LM_002253 [Alteromonadaceae bacterium]|jgi:hypothetical protein